MIALAKRLKEDRVTLRLTLCKNAGLLSVVLEV